MQRKLSMKQKFAKLMYGRCGSDELSRFLSSVGLILLVLSVILGFWFRTLQIVLIAVALTFVIFVYIRVFSRNFEKRRAENARYLNFRRRIGDWHRLRRDMWTQRREYRFFICPSCKAVLRVPKGKGRIRVVCRKCGTAFEKKT